MTLNQRSKNSKSPDLSDANKRLKEIILVVDDDPAIRELFKEAFSNIYDIETAEDGVEGIEAVRKLQPDLVILDNKMPRLDGISVLTDIKNSYPDLIVMMITAFKDTEQAVEAMKLGAYDYIIKPFDLNKLQIEIKNALKTRKIQSELISLRKEIYQKYRFDRLIGKSQKMQEVFEMISKVLTNDARVLIRGESGTGKELVARAIHVNGHRRDNPFIAINAAALPDSLIENELFGHEKGSFTGATELQRGKFEQAHGGTLFLDEIGSLKLELQAKLLRVLQESEVERIGGKKTIPIDVRIVSATGANLEKKMESNEFREDLFYRLNVVPILLPPLRERMEDIPLLIESFVKNFNQRFHKEIEGIDEDALQLFYEYSWPGNIRELENVMERLIVLSKGHGLIQSKEVQPLFQDNSRERTPGQFKVGMSLEEIEAEAIRATFHACRKNLTKTAKLMKITRKTLRSKLRKYQIGEYEEN